jgi:hypothetical protein
VVRANKILIAAVALVAAFLLLGTGLIAYDIGYTRGVSAENKILLNNQEQFANSSTPASYDPYHFTFSFQGNDTRAFVPIVLLASNEDSQLYVTYSCQISCVGTGNSDISILDIGSMIPYVTMVEGNGSVENTSQIALSAPTILEQSAESETFVYTLSPAGQNASGYYSFIFPFTCDLEPLLYVGQHSRDLDYTLIKNWLISTKGVSQTCPFTEVDVDILGFSNTYYNRLSVEYTSS